MITHRYIVGVYWYVLRIVASRKVGRASHCHSHDKIRVGR